MSKAIMANILRVQNQLFSFFSISGRHKLYRGKDMKHSYFPFNVLNLLNNKKFNSPS